MTRTPLPAHRAGLLRAVEFLHPAKGAIAAILGLALALAAVNTAEPLALRSLFDGLAGGRAGGAAAAGLVALVVLGLSREALAALSSWLTWRTRIGIQYRLTEATVGRLHRLPISFHRAEGVGAVMTRLDRSIQGLVGALAEIAFNVIPAAAYLA
ncbi:MAG TPA: ABC transporter transmembrane domain-containing protein, partial [Anaeromyxobacter sp.]